jgi:hypothetical protein
MLLVGAAVALAGCGGSSDTDPVVHVDDVPITRGQLATAVDHFRQEAAVEGRTFPDKGSSDYKTVERQTLRLLVYRSQLEQSAERLGVPVTGDEVRRRLTGSSEDAEESGEFARDTLRAQIAYEHIYRKVTKGVATARRGAAMRTWIARMPDDFDVQYDDSVQ